MEVVGVVGRIGSGKDEVVKYLQERCSAEMFSVGDVVRETARQENVTPTRTNLHRLSSRYMKDHGPDVFMRRLIHRIEEDSPDAACITGIRTPLDVALLRRRFGQRFLLLHVDVSDARTRFERVSERDDPRDPQTFDDFLEQDRSEEEQFGISKAIERCDVELNNDGSLQDLHRQIDRRIIEERLADRIDCT